MWSTAKQTLNRQRSTDTARGIAQSIKLLYVKYVVTKIALDQLFCHGIPSESSNECREEASAAAATTANGDCHQYYSLISIK